MHKYVYSHFLPIKGVLTLGRFNVNFLRTTVMRTVYCESREGQLTPTLCILNSRTSLHRATGNHTDSLSRYRSTHVIWYPARCSAANKNAKATIKAY